MVDKKVILVKINKKLLNSIVLSVVLLYCKFEISTKC